MPNSTEKLILPAGAKEFLRDGPENSQKTSEEKLLNQLFEELKKLASVHQYDILVNLEAIFMVTTLYKISQIGIEVIGHEHSNPDNAQITFLLASFAIWFCLYLERVIQEQKNRDE